MYGYETRPEINRHMFWHYSMPFCADVSVPIDTLTCETACFFLLRSRSFFLTFFSRFRRVRFSRSVSAAAYLLRMAKRRFLPARVRRLLVLTGMEAAAAAGAGAGRVEDDVVVVVDFRWMTRHGSAVPGF